VVVDVCCAWVGVAVHSGRRLESEAAHVKPPAVPQQVLRLVVAIAVALVALLVARSLLIPKTFGERGRYRAAAADSIAAGDVKFAGSAECVVCHDDVEARFKTGRHRGLACEVCHGPAVEHANAPIDIQPPAPRDRAFCPLCHSYNAARPTGFPQIDPMVHNPLDPCITCHEPHEPEPPHTPEECSACHGQISRQKAVSHHARLACTVCHEVPEAHKISPREVTPTKPTTRDFCGQCHAHGPALGFRAPQIDLATHNPEYLCWQCHYPHFPEAGGQ